MHSAGGHAVSGLGRRRVFGVAFRAGIRAAAMTTLAARFVDPPAYVRTGIGGKSSAHGHRNEDRFFRSPPRTARRNRLGGPIRPDRATARSLDPTHKENIRIFPHIGDTPERMRHIDASFSQGRKPIFRPPFRRNRSARLSRTVRQSKAGTASLPTRRNNLRRARPQIPAPRHAPGIHHRGLPGRRQAPHNRRSAHRPVREGPTGPHS